MKILLPHREATLDASLGMQERKTVVDALLAEEIEFHAQTMTLEEYLRFTWNKQTSKFIMDMIAYYLTKEEKDNEVLSNKKIEEMEKGSKRHVTFGSMGLENQTKFGLSESEETL